MTASINPNKFEYFTSMLPHGKHHLIAVDAELRDLDVLLADLEPKCSVLVVERDQDAIALITQILALFAQSNMAAESLVILVSAAVVNNSAGEILIGQESLTVQQLMERSSEIKHWNVQKIQIFSDHAGMAGQVIEGQAVNGQVIECQFVETLAQLSGATVIIND